MNELADLLLSASPYIPSDYRVEISDVGTRVSLLVQELKETSLVINDDFREVVNHDLAMNKANMELFVENESLKMKILQFEKRIKELSK